jgi:hypothetical protein
MILENEEDIHGSGILGLELLGDMENKLLLSSDMGRITSLVLFAILPYFIRLPKLTSEYKGLTESVITISLGRTVVFYSSAQIFSP